MLRLFQQRAAEILMLLTAVKGYVGGSTKVGAMAGAYYRGDYGSSTYSSLTSGARDQLNRIAKGNSGNETTVDEVINDLLAQHQAERNGDTPYNDIIDDIARILQMPKAHFVLSNQTLRNLQNAILIPEELREFRKSVRAGCGCAGCGNDIGAGEMVSLEMGGDGIPMVFCTICRHPEVVPCHTCRKPVGFRQYTPDNHHYCDEHKKSKGEKKAPSSLYAAMLEGNQWRSRTFVPAETPTVLATPTDPPAPSTANMPSFNVGNRWVRADEILPRFGQTAEQQERAEQLRSDLMRQFLNTPLEIESDREE